MGGPLSRRLRAGAGRPRAAGGMIMTDIVLLGAFALWMYSYAGYPALLWLASRRRAPRRAPASVRWPAVSIVLPGHNEAPQIAEVLQVILAPAYPAPRH